MRQNLWTCEGCDKTELNTEGLPNGWKSIHVALRGYEKNVEDITFELCNHCASKLMIEANPRNWARAAERSK